MSNNDILRLVRAAEEGDVELVQQLVAAGVHQQQQQYARMAGLTALHISACTGQQKAVLTLLAAGAEKNMLSDGRERVTALHLAAVRGRHEVVRVLLAPSADLEASALTSNNKPLGLTPLHFAAGCMAPGRHEVVRLLLDAGAQVDAASDIGSTPLYRAA
jgi:ankyrin repeat protein